MPPDPVCAHREGELRVVDHRFRDLRPGGAFQRLLMRVGDDADDGRDYRGVSAFDGTLRRCLPTASSLGQRCLAGLVDDQDRLFVRKLFGREVAPATRRIHGVEIGRRKNPRMSAVGSLPWGGGGCPSIVNRVMPGA